MQSNKRLTALFCLATAVSLSACQQKGASQDSEGRTIVKIGFAAPLTGPQAHYGVEYKNGVTLAIEDANATHPTLGGQPVKFELEVADDQADPKTATERAQNFVDENVSGVIGHFNSGTSIPASKIYFDAGIPQIAMATAAELTNQGFKTTFRSMTSDTQQGKVMGRFVVKKLGAKKVAVIDDRTAYGQGLADEFAKAVKAAGGVVIVREYTNDKATDFSAILTAIKAVKPNAIFFGGADVQSAQMVKQMKRLSIKVPLVSGEMTKTPNFLSIAGADAEGTIASLAGLPLDQMPKGKQYAAHYKARFQQSVATYSPYGYDATRVMIAAMEKADSANPAKYLPVLANIDYTDGVTSSHISYDKQGNLKIGGITVYRVKNGQWTVLESIGSKGS